jgi:ADP-ribose pyrophosphatase
MLLEIPAGKIEKDETPRQAAVREMAEEIGCSGTLRPLLKWYLAPGYSTELMHIFVATNLREITRGLLDNDENIEIRKMRLSAAIKKCLNGNIEDAKTIAALLAYYSQSN